MKTYAFILAALVVLSCSAVTPAQKAICETYLSCIRSQSPAVELQERARYGADAACWRDSRSAGACVAACEAGVGLLTAEGVTCTPAGLVSP